MSKFSMPRRKAIIFLPLYLLFLFIVFEASSRLIWAVTFGVPFFSPQKMYYVFYPELKRVEKRAIPANNGQIDILLLGGSVLNPNFGNIAAILEERLAYETKKPVRIYNLAKSAHSSADSYYKYGRLMDKHFDLVIFYHGINEVRVNNVPPSMFKPDYSHYSWYKQIVLLEKNDDIIRFTTLPFTLNLLLMQAQEGLGLSNSVPKHWPKPSWVEYGRSIKSAKSFEDNLKKILAIAASKREKVLLMTFAYYVPADYTKEKFDDKKLDYTIHGAPIEKWGKPENVVAGISAHNQVIRAVAKDYKNTYFVDQNELMPKRGDYFNDICHFTYKGSEKFVDNIFDVVLRALRERDVAL